MATLSQIMINNQLYNIADTTAQTSVNSLITTVDTTSTTVTNLINKVWTIAEGGTGQNNINDASRVFYGSKTAGDSWSMTEYRTGGYITSNKTVFNTSIICPYRFYNYTGVNLNGTYTIRQNDKYLFGSTSSTPYSLSGHYSCTIREDGLLALTITTGATQSAATNNDCAAIVFNSLTVTLT